MAHYPWTATERAMKVQEVILKAIGGQLRWIQAAAILGISARTMRRWKQRYERQGYDGLFDRRTRRPSPRRVPLPVVEQVLRLYREQYFDFNVRHFHEQLRRGHQIALSYTWVKTCLQIAGLVPRRRRRGPHRLRRPRRPLPGLLLQLDGSEHAWIPGLPGRQTLLALLDDATNEVYTALLVPEETTRAVLGLLCTVVEEQGLFCSLYTDRASLFVTTRHRDAPHQQQQARQPTQVARALQELGIQLILAHSPQAKGRIERLFGTWQGRLPQELRVHGTTTYAAANTYLEQAFLPWHNRHLTVEATQPGTAFVPCPRPDLDRGFALQHTRTVAADNTVPLDRRVFQLHRSPLRVSFAKCRVTVYEHLDGTLSIGLGPHTLGRYNARGQLLPPQQGPRSARKRTNRTDHVPQKADSFTC
jgi:transposase